MKQPWVLLLVLVLLVPVKLPAQRGGGRGGGTGRTPGTGSGGGNSNDNELAREVQQVEAAQANDDQAAEFRQLVKSTAVTQQQVQELEKIAKPGDPAIPAQAAALQTALDARRSSQEHFVQGLSKAQKTELKEPLKNLSSASARVGSDWAALRRELDRARIDSEHVSKAEEKLNDAFARLQAGQKELGAEMGIQP
jgi:hypothetical protein